MQLEDNNQSSRFSGQRPSSSQVCEISLEYLGVSGYYLLSKSGGTAFQ